MQGLRFLRGSLPQQRNLTCLIFHFVQGSSMGGMRCLPSCFTSLQNLQFPGWYNQSMEETNLTPPSETAPEPVAEPVAEHVALPMAENPSPPARPSVLLWSVLVAIAFVLGLVTGFLIWERPLQARASAAEQKLAVQEQTAVASATDTAAQDQAAVPEQVKRYDVPIANNPILGSAAAPITIIEFSDYECPFCQRWHQEVFPKILETYGDKVRLVYRDFPLYGVHPNAESAAEAANCAGEQDHYYDFHNLLLGGGKEFSADLYKAYAQSLKLNVNSFTRCMDEHRYQAEVKADYDYASQLGVRSTPTFFVNGLAVVGAQPFEVFQQVIDLELAGKIPK
jgi:protein-disulfide isomerase